VLSMSGGGGQGLRTVTALGHGLYQARIRTDVGGGAIVAFYLMAVDNDKRNDPAYRHLHDEIDFELVSTLWREGSYLADNVTWFNAFHKHTAVILPKNPQDDAGGSMMALARTRSSDMKLFNRHVLPDLDQSTNFIGPNFNDGQYYTYSIDWNAERIIYSVHNSAGELVKDYRLDRSSDAWPTQTMYLALSIWSATDSATQKGFSGRFDSSFGRPMRAYFDFVRYAPSEDLDLPGSANWNGAMPWQSCGFKEAAPAPALDCRAYNRDGITCEAVAYSEGQQGYPWGSGGGKFRCIKSCLQWISR
jgi:beta-glucanase (GH16 family)